MVKSRNSFDDFCRSFELQGLTILGALELQPVHCPVGHDDQVGCNALLVGNHGPDMWNIFSASPEYADSQPDPMNRWTRRVITNLTADLECEAFYPFDKPYWPFQRIAQTAMEIRPSPLGILVHPQYGLWHALRGLLIIRDFDEMLNQFSSLLPNGDKMNHPCDTCTDKPCLTACPVAAFTGEQLNVRSCFAHIDGGEKPDCLGLGCMARNACPIGIEHRYCSDQVAFHMRAYRGIPPE
ncbi:MAG: ferredoxin [Rhizobiaceae bacterium]